MKLNEVVIVDACRSPVGNLNGSLSKLNAHDITSQLIEKLLKKNQIDPEAVSEVILGQVLTGACGQNAARQAAIKAKLPEKVPAYSVNMVCGSGLKAIALAYNSIAVGDSTVVIAGGQESMSKSPHCAQMRGNVRFGNFDLQDSLIKDGLTDAFFGIHMGETAENIAEMYDISRESQDEFSLNSQKKYQNALTSNAFEKEIYPINVKPASSEVFVDKDEFPKNDSSLQALSKLKPCFKKNGTVTAGNCSGINDGSAVVLMMSLNEASSKGLTPLAKIISFSQIGLDPKIMGMGPVSAINSALAKANWRVDEVDLFEINEAFASQSVAVIKELKIDQSKVNVNGGSIAIGHPIGASGARIVVTLLHALKKRGLKRGVASLCIGGGMGVAMCLEV